MIVENAKAYTTNEIIQKVKDFDLSGIEEIRFIVYGKRLSCNVLSPEGEDIIGIAEFLIHDDVYVSQGILTPKGNIRAFAKRWFQEYSTPFFMTIEAIDRPTGINKDR
jgi:hypothetical protein